MSMESDEMLAGFARAKSIEELFYTLSSHVAAVGFEYCCYGFRSPVPVSRRPVRILDNYPAGWMEQYLQRGFIKIDPVVSLCAQRALPLVWSDAVFRETLEMWDAARAVGLKAGVSQSAWGNGGSFGILSMARSTGEITPAEARSISMYIAWLANAVHTEMSRFLFPHADAIVNQGLTQREREILCWTSEGKSSHEVGMILNISSSTVNFHIGKILKKMDVTNKMQAVARAVAMGVIGE